jgi:uncharacterized cupin superfamily protein
MPPKGRPSCIAHWTEIEDADTARYSGDTELLSLNASFGKHFGLAPLGIHHVRIPPGRRTSYPHAESSEQEFAYVIEGTPDVWLDGHLHRLRPGDGVGFPAGTGLSHTFINNTDSDVRLLVVGETPKPDNRIVYPMNPERKALREDWWQDAPPRTLGPHDGLPDRRRKA